MVEGQPLTAHASNRLSVRTLKEEKNTFYTHRLRKIKTTQNQEEVMKQLYNLGCTDFDKNWQVVSQKPELNVNEALEQLDEM